MVYLHAVVVGALAVEMATVVVHAAVVQRAKAHESVLQGVVPLLMHVIMPYHILLTGESLSKHTTHRVCMAVEEEETSSELLYYSCNSCRALQTIAARWVNASYH